MAWRASGHTGVPMGVPMGSPSAAWPAWSSGELPSETRQGRLATLAVGLDCDITNASVPGQPWRGESLERRAHRGCQDNDARLNSKRMRLPPSLCKLKMPDFRPAFNSATPFHRRTLERHAHFRTSHRSAARGPEGHGSPRLRSWRCCCCWCRWCSWCCSCAGSARPLRRPRHESPPPPEAAVGPAPAGAAAAPDLRA